RLGVGFRLASELLGSTAERVACNVYDLEPARVGGQVDFAFVGAILEHLRDPVGALERVRTTLRPGGVLVVVERISVRATLRAPARSPSPGSCRAPRGRPAPPSSPG